MSDSSNQKISTVAAILLIAALPLVSSTRISAEEIRFVGGQQPQHVRYTAQAWQTSAAGLSGEGVGNNLALSKGLEGPFQLKARLRLVRQKQSAAGIRINGSFFGLEGKNAEELFLSGPLFGGRKSLGKSSRFFKRGSTIVLEIVATNSSTRFFIDGKLVVEGQTAGKVSRLEFVPWRSRMEISELTVNGRFFDVPEPISRGYSIPTLDLANETERQVLVDRQKGQYLGHPTTVLLEDHRTMICVYPRGHGRGGIVMKRSEDAGLTWSKRLPTPASWSTSLEVPTIHRVEDKTGKRRLILFSGLYPIRMSYSEDDGKSWSELQPIGDFGGIVTMGCVEKIGNGRYMALFHDDGRFIRKGGIQDRRFHVYKTVSSDGGMTWSEPVVIASHPSAHLCEPGLIRSPNGKQLTVLLRENSRKFNSFMIQSSDEGSTWSDPVELPAALTGDRHTGRYAPDGRLLISFRDTTLRTPTPGDWVAWVGTYDDIVSGREGQYRVRLLDNRKSKDCAYPGVEVLPDGTFVLTTYGHWTENEAPYIMSVRLRLSELDRKARKKEFLK
ncbi:MAG: sialidase family protein [Planctomycetota bacterium]|nr:sialidase family protein [Planctomycetota bacterium]